MPYPSFEYHVLLLIAVGLAGYAARKTPRAWLWIAALAISFVVSVAYLYQAKPGWPGVWWPPHAGIATLCDAAIVVLIFRFGVDRWERVGLRTIMMVSVTINLVQTSAYTLGFPPMMPADTYAILLEVINYLALAMIGGVGILDRKNARDRISHRPHRFMASVGEFAHAQSAAPPLAKW
jgi:hypothetical protein